MTTTFNISACALIASLTASVGFAQSTLTEDQQRAVTARNAQMTLYGFHLGPLAGMARDQIPYDSATAVAAAGNLAALAALDQSALWVDGTDASTGTRARAEIWSDPAGYAAAKLAMENAAKALAAVAGDGPDAFKAAFGPVGAACGACHEGYRAPRS
jgi:cytochrome c556